MQASRQETREVCDAEAVQYHLQYKGGSSGYQRCHKCREIDFFDDLANHSNLYLYGRI